MIKVFSIIDNIKELYGIAKNNHEYFNFVDDIEELGLEWDIELI